MICRKRLLQERALMEKPAKVGGIEQSQGAATKSAASDSQSAKSSYVNYAQRRRRVGGASDLTKVKSILSKVLSHRGLDKKVERYGFILRWHEIVGERLAEVSKPECIINKQLIVNVMHPVWAQELTMIKPVLLESLAKLLPPGDVVRDMTFRVRQLESR